MKCSICNSERIVQFTHPKDVFFVREFVSADEYNAKYFQYNLICLDCGQAKGNFPLGKFITEN